MASKETILTADGLKNYKKNWLNVRAKSAKKSLNV